jgi:hypothetical protein
MGGFSPLVEFHREGSASAACAAGLFSIAQMKHPDELNAITKCLVYFKVLI